MKTIVILSLIIFSNFTFAQTEQISLNFFAQELLPKLKKTKVFYDGKIISKSDYEIKKIDNEETVLENIIYDYSSCKDDSRGLSNKNFDFKKNFNFDDLMKYANVKNSVIESLKIPKNIVFKKILVNKKWKTGKLRYKINKLFNQKYNLKISPSIQIEKNTFLTRIFQNKQDFAHGYYYDIVVKNGKVIDWCDTSWIQ